MEALLLIALIIIIILLLKIKSFQKQTAEDTLEALQSVKKELQQLQASAKQMPVTEMTVEATDEKVVQWRPYIPPVTEQPKNIISQQKQVLEKETIVPDTFIEPEHSTITEEKVKQTIEPEAARGAWQNWLQNNPDLEKFIGENLVNKIGITVLVLGIAFFVKYAIDQNWIKETGRVSIGIGCGIILTGLAHYLRNTYRSFSSVLAGGGITVFYFTIAFAFHQYHLFSQTAAFVIMIVITIFAILLSLLYNKLELAVIAAIGGFITPFLVSTGNGNYIVLFTYLIILNIGMLALSWFKKWPSINVIALFFTIIIYGGWLVGNTVFQNEFVMYKNSFLFATTFFFLFLAMNMIYNLRTKHPFKAIDFSLLLLITFAYYAAGITNLHFWNAGAYQGLFTVALALVNFCFALYLFKTDKGDKNLLYLLIGLTLTFISLAAPVQLHGHTITLFWSAEFVLLYWLSQKSGIAVFKYASLIIMSAMLISLLMDWEKANSFYSIHLPLIYNSLQGFITNIVAVVAFSMYAVLLSKEKTINYVDGIKNTNALTAMALIAVFILYLTCVFGVNLFFYKLEYLDVPNTWHQVITYLFVALFLLAIAKFRMAVSLIARLFLVAGCIAMYVLSASYVNALRNGVLSNLYPAIQLWIHWLASSLLLYLIYQAILLYRKNNSLFVQSGRVFIWLVNIVSIVFFSIESMHAYVYFTTPLQNSSISLQQYSKAGLTIVWALCSFTIMWLGMKHKYKTLRIISLSLFSLALLKLFFFDIRNISEGGKIAAFIMLGILLLIISFMYQKLKKIIIDDAVQ